MRLFKPSYPPAAFELSSGALTMVRLERHNNTQRLEDYSVEALDPEVVAVSMIQENVRRRDELVRAIRRLAKRLGYKQEKVSLVLPDNTTKISILELESAPRNRKEMTDLISWQLKKVTPFAMAEGHISYQRFPPSAGGGKTGAYRVMVAIIHRLILEQLESCFEAAGLHPGLVDISTNNIYNLFMDKITGEIKGKGDAMLVNCEDDGFSLVVISGSAPYLFRSKSLVDREDTGSSDDYPYDLVWREIRNSIIYCTEKLGRPPLNRIYVRGTGFHILGLRDLLEQEVSTPAEVLDPGKMIAVRPGLDAEPGAMQRLAPALGAALGR